MYETAGASLMGPDLRQWPARMVDAFTVLETERIRGDQIAAEAEQQEGQ